MDLFSELNNVDEEEIDTQKYMTFWIDNQVYALEIEDVVEIIGLTDITIVPEFPNYAKGVINLRGDIIPVIDSRLRFKKEEKQYNQKTCIIIVKIKDTLTGFIVDKVEEVIDIEENQIESAPDVTADYKNRFINSVVKYNKQVILIINFKKVLEEKESDSLIEMTQALSKK